jgi:hypothetical protein
MKHIIKPAVLLGICIPLALVAVVLQIASNILQATGNAIVSTTDVIEKWTAS